MVAVSSFVLLALARVSPRRSSRIPVQTRTSAFDQRDGGMWSKPGLRSAAGVSLPRAVAEREEPLSGTQEGKY